MRARFVMSVALGCLLTARAASSATCYALRPTEQGAAWSYAGAATTAVDTPEGNVRVWFALDGPHAPTDATEAQPPAALAAGAAAEAALESFEALGFRRPLPDGPDTPCLDLGGDARLDIYLYDFAAADGTIIVDRCVSGGIERCSGFAIVENDFSNKGYETPDEGYRSVVPHELFHLVQYAYSTNGEAWWAEGSAQWAAKQVFPELQDLEAFLPAFFARTDRPLDFPPVGAVASFSYGAAIWPVFLSEKHGATVVRSVFERLEEGASTVLDAAELALEGQGTSLDAAFTEFAEWNAATGARAGSSSYANAADYPEVKLDALPNTLPSSTAATLAGLSARYFEFAGGTRRQLNVTGDKERFSARFVPLVGSDARLSEIQQLPVATSNAGILVISGRGRDHRDVAFTIRVDDAATADGGAPSGGAENEAGRPDQAAEGGARSGQAGAMAHLPEPSEQPADTVALAGDAATYPPTRASSGCSLAPAEISRPSLWRIVAALAMGVGLGRLAERSRRRRAASEGSAAPRFAPHPGGTFGYRH